MASRHLALSKTIFWCRAAVTCRNRISRSKGASCIEHVVSPFEEAVFRLFPPCLNLLFHPSLVSNNAATKCVYRRIITASFCCQSFLHPACAFLAPDTASAIGCYALRLFVHIVSEHVPNNVSRPLAESSHSRPNCDCPITGDKISDAALVVIPHVDQRYTTLFAELMEICRWQRNDIRPGCRRIVGDPQGSDFSRHSDRCFATKSACAAWRRLEVCIAFRRSGQVNSGEGPVYAACFDVRLNCKCRATKSNVKALSCDSELSA